MAKGINKKNDSSQENLFETTSISEKRKPPPDISVINKPTPAKNTEINILNENIKSKTKKKPYTSNLDNVINDWSIKFLKASLTKFIGIKRFYNDHKKDIFNENSKFNYKEKYVIKLLTQKTHQLTKEAIAEKYYRKNKKV